MWLFSSNIRPLYEQDILDVLAAPSGAIHQFRYERRWVDPVGQAEWLSLPPGTPVLVHFSLQQTAKYYGAVFFPVRRGRIKGTFARGQALFVEFVLGDIVSLPEPENLHGKPDFAAQTERYAAFLQAEQVPRPYEASASLGVDLLTDPQAPIDLKADQVVLFERAARYLQPTDSFRSARFLMFLRLGGRGSKDDVVPDGEGVFQLEGGTTYTLELFHYQPVEIAADDSFTVSVDGSIIRVIGRPGFDIGSRYDRIALSFHAVQSVKFEARETVLVIEPAEGVKGPRLAINVRVEPPRGRIVASALVSTLALVVLGSASLLPFSVALKALVILACAGVVTMLSVFGLYVPALAGFRFPADGSSQHGGHSKA